MHGIGKKRLSQVWFISGYWLLMVIIGYCWLWLVINNFIVGYEWLAEICDTMYRLSS